MHAHDLTYFCYLHTQCYNLALLLLSPVSPTNTQNDRSSALSASSAIEFAESRPTLDLSVVYWGDFGHMLNNNYPIMSDRAL